MKGRAIAGAGLAAVLAVAAAFVAPWEGLELRPYRDLVGKLTWCYGETRGTPKEAYTKAECDALLREGLGQFYAGMSRCIHRPLTEGQWVAVLSWSWNVGQQAACGSTLVRQINAGHPAAVWCRQLLRWDYADGRRVRGLTNRRKAEYSECVK